MISCCSDTDLLQRVQTSVCCVFLQIDPRLPERGAVRRLPRQHVLQPVPPVEVAGEVKFNITSSSPSSVLLCSLLMCISIMYCLCTHAHTHTQTLRALTAHLAATLALNSATVTSNNTLGELPHSFLSSVSSPPRGLLGWEQRNRWASRWYHRYMFQEGSLKLLNGKVSQLKKTSRTESSDPAVIQMIQGEGS